MKMGLNFKQAQQANEMLKTKSVEEVATCFDCSPLFIQTLAPQKKAPDKKKAVAKKKTDKE